jgi:hypothetical protein
MPQYPRVLDEAGIIKHIYLHLGGGVVDIHLQECHYKEAIEEAVRWWRAKKGVKKWFDLQVLPYQTEYPLPEDVDTVLEVVLPDDPGPMGRAFDPFYQPGDGVPWGIYSTDRSGLGYLSSYGQLLQQIETTQKVFSSDPDWRHDTGSRVLQIYPLNKRSGIAKVFYKSHTLTLEQLPERDNDLVKRYARAYAKKILGHIWGKYTDGFPAAQGNRSLNYSQMLSEADAEIAQLEQEISDSAMPMDILIG